MFTSDVHSIQHSFDVFAALWFRAFTNTVCINWLALSWSDQFLVFTIRNAVTVCIAAYTVSINWATFRSVWLKIKLVSYTITISIIQNRFWKFHVAWGIDFAVSIIQWIEPPQWFNSFFTDVIIQTKRKESIRIKIPCLSRACRSTCVII